MRKLLVGVVVVLVLAYVAALGVGVVLAAKGAQQSSGGTTQTAQPTGGPNSQTTTATLAKYQSIFDNALAKALNLTVGQVQQARKNGTSLAQLAQQQGVSMVVVRQAITKAQQDVINKALSDGAITKAQADALSRRLALQPWLSWRSFNGLWGRNPAQLSRFRSRSLNLQAPQGNAPRPGFGSGSPSRQPPFNWGHPGPSPDQPGGNRGWPGRR